MKKFAAVLRAFVICGVILTAGTASAASAAKSLGDFSAEGYTPRAIWEKSLAGDDLALAVKIYEVLTSFGASQAEVVKKLGAPTNTYSKDWYDGVHELYGYGGKKGDKDTDSGYNKADARFEFLTKNGKSYVSYAGVKSGKYKLKHVNVGDSIDAAKKIFGSNINTEQPGLYSDGTGILVYHARLRQLPDGSAYEGFEIVFDFGKDGKISGIGASHWDTLPEDEPMDEDEGWGEGYDDADSGGDETEGDFTAAVFAAWDNFHQRGDAKLTLADEKGKIFKRRDVELNAKGLDDAVEYYQGRDDVSVMRRDGPNRIYVFYYTKDPSLTFPGGVRVGGPVSAALAPGLIPGEYATSSLSNGRKGHSWTAGNTVIIVYEDGKGVVTAINYGDYEQWDRIKAVSELMTLP